jgi:hypothetical protein
VTEGPGRSREWLRAAGLLALSLSLAPVAPLALVTVPLALLGAGLGGWRGGLVALPALLVAWGAGPEPGLWFLERGWALLAGGWFLALTLRWPDLGLTTRGIGAAAAAVLSSGAVLAGTPGGWSVAEFAVRSRLQEGAAAAAELMRRMGTGEGETAAPVVTLENLVETQLYLLPALLGLATVAALSLSWWVIVRSATGRPGALGPLSGFRFPDPLVWVLIGGVVILLVGGDPWVRVGVNAVAFMMPLYALRGAGVVLGVRGGLSLWGWLLVAIGLIFAAPALLFGAFLVGLGDTWLDLRARAGEAAG